MLDSIEHWIQKVHHQDEQNVHQNIKFTTKVRFRRINLTEEQVKILSNSVRNDDIEILKDLINQLTPDLKKDPNISSNLNILISSIKKVYSFFLYEFGL